MNFQVLNKKAFNFGRSEYSRVSKKTKQNRDRDEIEYWKCRGTEISKHVPLPGRHLDHTYNRNTAKLMR